METGAEKGSLCGNKRSFRLGSSKTRKNQYASTLSQQDKKEDSQEPVSVPTQQRTLNLRLPLHAVELLVLSIFFSPLISAAEQHSETQSILNYSEKKD